MNECLHRRVNGDNYGESCADCGQQLKGYGYGGWFGSNLRGGEKCLREWTRFYNCQSSAEFCRFCELPKSVQNDAEVSGAEMTR